MRSIKEIDADISQQRNEVKTKLSVLLEERKEYWNSIFDDSQKLKKAVENAEKSCSYQLDTYGEVESWYRVSGGLSEFADCQDELNDWLADNHGLRLDFENDCLINFLGEGIMIDKDGDVFLSNKLVILKRNYTDEADRNAQIEAYMEKTGYFPGVFSVDYHGNVTFVDTKKKDE